MPGEFYIEGKKQQLDLTDIKNITIQLQGIINQVQNVLTNVQNAITQLGNSVTQVQNNVTQVQNNVTNLVTKSEGVSPVTGAVAGDWQAGESDVATIGSHGARYKVQSLLLSIHNLAGSVITVRMYMMVNENERKVYEQSFDASTGPPGLWVINGTVGIHEALRVTLQSNDANDNGKAIDYDCMMEVM